MIFEFNNSLYMRTFNSDRMEGILSKIASNYDLLPDFISFITRKKITADAESRRASHHVRRHVG